MLVYVRSLPEFHGAVSAGACQSRQDWGQVCSRVLLEYIDDINRTELVVTLRCLVAVVVAGYREINEVVAQDCCEYDEQGIQIRGLQRLVQ